MTRLLLRLAGRVALSRSRAQRWRQTSVVLGSAVLTLTFLASLALVAASQDAQARREARLPVLASAGAPAGLLVSLRGEIWDGRQFPVNWLSPGDSSVPLLPPGLDRLPEPGTAVLSPGLYNNSAAVSGLGFVVSDAGDGPHGTIGDLGLASQSEWLVYARPPAGRDLTTEGIVFRIASFAAGRGDPSFGFETEEPTPSVRTAAFGAVLLFLLPGLFLAAASSAALSPLRTTRAQTLRRHGLPKLAVRALGATESALLAAIGAVPIGIAWAALAPSFSSLPGSDLVWNPESFAVPVATVTAACAAAVLVQALFGAVAISMANAASTGARRRMIERVRGWRAVPLPAVLGLMILGRATGGSHGATLVMGSLVVALVTLPITLPWLVQRLGDLLASGRQPERWLAGRRLAFSSTALARPAVAVGALMFLTGSVTGVYAQLSNGPDDEGGSVNNFLLGWRSPVEGDVPALASQLPEALVVPLLTTDRGTQALFQGCAELSRLVMAADPDACFEEDEVLPSSLRESFEQQYHVPPVLAEVAILAEDSYVQDVLIIGGDDVTAERIWGVTNSRLSAVNLFRLGNEPLAPPGARLWLLSSGGVAAAILLLTMLATFGNRVLALVDEDRRLLRVALDDRQVRLVQLWTLLAPLVTSILLGTGMALFFIWAASEAELALPVTPVVLVEMLLVSAVSGAAVLIVLRLQHAWTSASTTVHRKP